MKKANRFSFLQRLLALVLVCVMVYNILPNQATAAGESAAAGEAGMVADPSTVNSYTEMVGTENDGNRYAGRIWTDKSVYSDMALFEEDLDEELTAAQIKDLTDAVSDDEFLAVFYDSVNKVYINSDGTTSDTAGLRVAPTLNSNSEHGNDGGSRDQQEEAVLIKQYAD